MRRQAFPRGTTLKRLAIGLLGLLGGVGIAMGENGPQLGKVYWISSSSLADYRFLVRYAVQVGDRYLAVLLILPRSPEKAKSLMQHHGHFKRVAPAWMSSRWEIIQVGEGEYGSPVVMNPQAPGGSESIQHLFPQVLVRDATSEWCPYLWGTTDRLVCLNEFLEPQERYEPPVQARGYLTAQGEVWWKGSYRGYLLHRVDMRTSRIVESSLAIATLLQALKESELDPNLVGDFVTQWEELELQREESPPTGPPKEESSPSQPVQKWQQAIPSLELDIVVRNQRAYVWVMRPMALAVFRWPSGEFERLIPIRREDLPAWAHRYHDIRLIRLDLWRDRLAASFQLEGAIYYGDVLLENPDRAAQLARTWREEHPDEPLTAQTVVGSRMNYLVLEVDDRGVQRSWEPIAAFRGERHVGFGFEMPFFTDVSAWIAVRRKGQDEKFADFGVARLIF